MSQLLVQLLLLAVGLAAILNRKSWARSHLEFQRDVFKMRDTDDPKLARGERVVVAVGAFFVILAVAQLSGLIPAGR